MGLLTLPSTVLAQSNFDSSAVVVSLYQLEHRPGKEAKHLADKGFEMLKQREYQSAAELFYKANQLDNDYWDAQNYLGYAYYSLGQEQRAEAAFQRAIDIDPENAVAYANLGIAVLSKGDYELAEKCGFRALRLFPNLPQAKALLGIIEINQHQWTAKAHKLIEEAAPGIPSMRDILRRWPTGDHKGPKVTILISTLR